MKNIAVFVSGSGSNAENLARYFAESPEARVTALFCNRPDAYALTRAQQLGIDTVVFNRDEFYHTTQVADELQARHIDYIVLGGFLWLIPDSITTRYPGRILNIHPALLPKYGGKGMYGDHVHRAVIAAGETESGITIHQVNEHYDSGDIVFQAKVEVLPDDTPESLAAKIHALEYEHFPRIVEQELRQLP